MKKEYRRRSLKFKLFFILIIIALVFDVVMTGVSYYIYTSNINNESVRMCSGVAQTVASDITPNIIKSYADTLQGDSYILTGEKLSNLKQSLKDIESINIYAIGPDGMTVVFSADSESADAHGVGSVIPYGDFGAISPSLENGEVIQPVFSDENVTSYANIKEPSGKVIGYAVCTLSVRQQMQNRKLFITRLFYIVGLATVLVVILAYIHMCRILISPINKMETEIRKFAVDNSRGDEILAKLSKIKNRNVSEISKLQESFADLIGDVSIKQTEVKEFDDDIIEKMMSVIDPEELKA